MRISDWSSDVCSSDLQLLALGDGALAGRQAGAVGAAHVDVPAGDLLLGGRRAEAERLVRGRLGLGEGRQGEGDDEQGGEAIKRSGHFRPRRRASPARYGWSS